MASKENILSNIKDVLDTSEYWPLKISYILSNNTDKSVKAVAYKEDEPDIIVGVEINENGSLHQRIPDWDFNVDGYLLDDLQNGYEIVYMPLDEHAGIWECIDAWREEIDSKEGLQNYLQHCQRKGINQQTLSLLESDVKDIMDLYVEKNGNYEILTEMSIGKSAIVLAHNPKAPSPYVTWETASNRSWGYQSGHYFTRYGDAFNDFRERCQDMFNFSMKHKKEQSRPKSKKEHEYER